MAPPPQPGRHPQGSAKLTYDPAKQTLTVAATASGLVAVSDHAVDIHLGSTLYFQPIICGNLSK
jgi:hypothetical protein